MNIIQINLLAIILFVLQNDVQAAGTTPDIYTVTTIIQRNNALYSVGLVKYPGNASKLYRLQLGKAAAVEEYVMPIINPVVTMIGSEKANNPYSWTIHNNDKFEFVSCSLKIDPHGLHSGQAGILQIPMEDMEKPNQGFISKSMTYYPPMHHCTVAHVAPLSSLISECLWMYSGTGKIIWDTRFYTNLDQDREYIEQYLAIDGRLEVYRFPTDQYKPVSMDFTEYLENERKETQRRQEEGKNIRDRDRDGWELIASLPYLENEPFLVIELSSVAFLLNAAGHLYQIREDELPLAGIYQDLERKAKPGTRGSIILFKNKDNDTISLLEVMDDAVTPLVFKPKKVEYTDPFDPPDLTEQQEKALRALLHTMKTTREKPPVRPTPKRPTARPAARKPPSPADP